MKGIDSGYLVSISLLLGCAGSLPPPVAEPAVDEVSADSAEEEGKGSLLAELRGVGAEVYLVTNENGIVARVADREVRQLVAGAVSYARYARDLDLVWFTQVDRLAVLDLRAAEPPVTILSGLPKETVVTLDGKGFSLAVGNLGVPEYLRLFWADPPRTEVELVFGEVMNPDEVAAMRAAKIEGREWLVANLNRARRPELATEAVAVVDPRRRFDSIPCPDETECGLAMPFGSTGWELFVSYHDCGDYCHWDCLLYDPESDKLAAPPGTGAWRVPDHPEGPPDAGSCGPFYFDQSETLFGHSDQLCEVTGVCAAAGGTVLGFVDGPVIALADADR